MDERVCVSISFEAGMSVLVSVTVGAVVAR